MVTGLGLVTPLGGDVETSWANLLAGKSGAGTITRFDASDQKCTIACEVKLSLIHIFAQRAYDSGAETAAATFAMARAQYYAGNCRGGVGIGDAAVRLNPYDADTAGFQGVFKIACDQPLDCLLYTSRCV